MRWLSFIFGSIVFLFVLFGESYANVYTVKPGDSLIGISKRLGVKPYIIKRLNPNVEWLKIRPGQKIKIPSQKRVLATKKETVENADSNVYIVKPGDSLIRIAKKFNIKPVLIKKYNPHINWLKIRPNDKIRIPQIVKTPEISGNKANIKRDRSVYIVKKNDSLIKISRKLHISIKEIEALNPDIDWKRIRPNKKIKLPSAKTAVAINNNSSPNNKTEQSANNKQGSTTVKKTITAETLQAALIKKGCSLKPGTLGDGYYIVRSGDTLVAIARRFGLTLKRLMKLNPDKSRFIKPGDLIVLPGELTRKIMLSKKENLYIPPKYLVYSTPYKIKKGDTLSKIAHKFKTKVYVIKMLNNMGSNTLIAGNYIFVPNKNMIKTNRIELEYSLLRERRKALVHYAERFLGRPYRFGGDSLIHGIDCSAFVQKIYERFIKRKLPRTAEEQYRTVGVFVPLSRIQVGDLLFFHTMRYAKVTHVGIYIGNNRFIHAAGRRSGIKISRLTRYYLRRLVGVKRILSISNKYAYFRHRPG